jgi:hypothetical protein
VGEDVIPDAMRPRWEEAASEVVKLVDVGHEAR